MDGQDEVDSYLEGTGDVELSQESPATSHLSVLKKNNMQLNFIKDRVSGMYKCQMCSYKSMHRSSIKSHYAVHSSLRPYACDQCSYEAKRLNDLRKHKLIKHGKKLMSVRKKYTSHGEKVRSNGVAERSPKYAAESDNNDSHMEDLDTDNPSGNLLYHSLVGGASNSNGPVFPQPEPAGVMSMIIPSQRERSNSTGDIPDEVDKEGTVIVKPEPPDDYYTFQNKFPEHEDAVVIHSAVTPPLSNEALSPALKNSPEMGNSKSPIGSNASPSASLKSLAQSTSKDAGDSEVTRLHAASPSVISLLLQRRNLTGASLMTAAAAAAATSSQPKALKPTQQHQQRCSYPSSSSNYYSGAVPDSASRNLSAPQYNPLNLSYNSSQQQQTPRSSSESSHSSLPSSTSGRSKGVETKRGWTCEHCNIMFFDSAIYFMHMGLHSPDSAWQCNLCGQQLYDVYSFTSHFVNGHVAS